MPELTIQRLHPSRTPVPHVCMYCGEPSTRADERRVEHPADDKPAAGGGASTLGTLPSGDDPVSAAVGLLLLPFILWELLVWLVRIPGALARWWARPSRPAAASDTRPPPAPHVTVVAITTCDRHGDFRRRFVLAGVALCVALAALWWVGLAAAVADKPSGAALIVAALLATVVGPIGLAVWYTLAGPVIVDRVTRDAVVLDRVRPAYFTASGLEATQ